MRRLRAPVDDDIVARTRVRDTWRRSAERGRALGRCERRGAVVVSHRTPSARPSRGRGHRAHPAAAVPCRNSARAHRAGARDGGEALLNRTWRPALSVIGADGLPAIANAGNVLRPQTSLALSLRLPPLVEGDAAAKALRQLLEADPPYGAKVTFSDGHGATGWSAPLTAPWLTAALDRASTSVYGKPVAAMGEGGTIPFMAMLGVQFPRAQFLITGVLGPHSNAHGPNEFLHVPYAKKLTACVAHVVTAHASRVVD